MCAASFAVKLRKTRNVPRPPVHSSNLAAPWVLDSLTFSVVLYTATSVATAHTPITEIQTESQWRCHDAVAEGSIRGATANAAVMNTSEKVIHRHEMCLNLRGASANRRSRTYSCSLLRERERTER